MKINAISTTTPVKKIAFSSNKNIQKTIDKRAYVDAKTQNLTDITFGLLGLSLVAGLDNIKKLEKTSKFSIVAAIVLGGLLLTNCIRKIHYAKEFDTINQQNV